MDGVIGRLKWGRVTGRFLLEMDDPEIERHGIQHFWTHKVRRFYVKTRLLTVQVVKNGEDKYILSVNNMEIERSWGYSDEPPEP